ncbi:hypothetical protein Tco_1489940 [Tanacetum coccineum]
MSTKVELTLEQSQQGVSDDVLNVLSPLSNIISNRDIHRAGFSLDSKVAALIDHGSWTWPNEWYVKYPTLLNIMVPMLSKATDGLSWRNLNNMVGDFSVAKVWDCIRPRSNEIEWYHVVWFANQIPLHVILLWLVLKRKLKTQDTLRHWDVSNNTNVWEHFQKFTYISNISSDLNSIVGFITPLAKMRTIRNVIFKLVFATSSYFIWQERNNRLFNKTKMTHDQLIEIVKNNVRLKLLTCSFKKTANGQLLFDIWKLPESLMRSNHP